MSKYDKMMNDNSAQTQLEQELDFASEGMQELKDDTQRTVEIYNNAESVLNDIDERLIKATKLDKTDVAFLMLATALQIGRWVLFAELSKAADKKIEKSRVSHDDKSIQDMEKEKRNQYKQKHINDEHVKSEKHRDWANIIFDGVPYDVCKGCGKYGINMEGGYHRIHTLGHDPLLGWIFGTINILSDTITLDKTYRFRTFNVQMMNKPKHWTSESNIPEALISACNSIREDSKRLPAAVFTQALHLKSDEYTKLGLPIPLLEAFSSDLAGKLYKEGYDSLQLSKGLAIYAGQATVSVIINMIITLVHGLFYDEEKYQSRELYEVKTRKILSYSNVIASSSNVITVAGMGIAALYTENPELGKKAVSTLDVGGIIVTMYRLISDTKFINEVKREFLENEWYNAVVGEEYKFVTQVNEMSKKDIKKGIEIQAKADAAKAEKVFDGLAAHAQVLGDIKDTQHTVNQKVDTVLQDMSDQEASELYGLKTSKKLSDLDYTEKRVLSAAIYTLMASGDRVSDMQRKFFACIESYGVSERASDFDFENLRNIDSYSDRKIILKAICAFLFLGEFTFDFKDDSKYGWMEAFTSKRDVDEVCEEIEKEFSILGEDGIVNGYLLPTAASEQPEIKALPESEEMKETEEIDEDDMSYDYSLLFDTIGKVADDEDAFGKRVTKLDAAFVKRELGREYPNVSAGAAVEATKIANGYLIFTTYALYLKSGNILTGKYVRLPYQKIVTDKMHTAEGKLKGTRKLVIPYINESGKYADVEIDDTKVSEEKLRDLLIEAASLECTFPSTDENIQFADLDKEVQLLFAAMLVSVLKKSDRPLTEVYLMLKENDLHGEWNKIGEFDAEKPEDMIDTFINSVPYPSELYVTDCAMRIFMRVMARTNRIEGNEATVLMKDEEALIRRFDMFDRLSNAEFSILLKECSKDARKLSLDELSEIANNVESTNIIFKNNIMLGLQKMIETASAEEEAKRNTATAKLKRAVRENAVPAAKEAVKKAEERLKQIKLPNKK